MRRSRLILVLVASACATGGGRAPATAAPLASQRPALPDLLPPELQSVGDGVAWADGPRGVVYALDVSGALVTIDARTGKDVHRAPGFATWSIGSVGRYLYAAEPSGAGLVRLTVADTASQEVRACQLHLPAAPTANAVEVRPGLTRAGLVLVWHSWDHLEGGTPRPADPNASACGWFSFDPKTCATGDLNATRVEGAPGCAALLRDAAPPVARSAGPLGDVTLSVEPQSESVAGCRARTHWFLGGKTARGSWRRELASEPPFCPVP